MKFTVKIRNVFDNDKAMKAVASVTIDNAFAIHDVKVIKTEDKTFIAMPYETYTDKDGKETRRDVAHPINAETRKALESAVISAYEQKIAENH